jgi:hypothetical protein
MEFFDWVCGTMSYEGIPANAYFTLCILHFSFEQYSCSNEISNRDFIAGFAKVLDNNR